MKNKTIDIAILTGFFALYPWLTSIFWAFWLRHDGIPVADFYEHGIKPNLNSDFITTLEILPIVIVAIYFNAVGKWFKYIAILLSLNMIAIHFQYFNWIFNDIGEFNILVFNSLLFLSAWCYISIKLTVLVASSNKTLQPDA